MKHVYLIALLTFAFCLLTLSGCDSLRFQPSESQKQIAFDTQQKAIQVRNNGTSPGSPESQRLVEGTTSSLSYIGIPANPVITDYNATLKTSQADAAKRPQSGDVLEAVHDTLGIIGEVALALGLGGTVIGGRSVKKWIGTLQTKAKALEEVVMTDQNFLDHSPPETVEQFKKVQNTNLSLPTVAVTTQIRES